MFYRKKSGRKTLKERYEDSYTSVFIPADNKKGYQIKYIYYAPWYVWKVPSENLVAEKIIITLASAAGLLAFLAGACMDLSINKELQLFLPCVLALCCHIMELMGILQFDFARSRTTKMTYDEIRRIMDLFPRARTWFALAAAAVAIAVMTERGSLLYQRAVPVCIILWTLSGWFVASRFSKIDAATEKNDSLRYYEELMEQNGLSRLYK